MSGLLPAAVSTSGSTTGRQGPDRRSARWPGAAREAEGLGGEHQLGVGVVHLVPEPVEWSQPVGGVKLVEARLALSQGRPLIAPTTRSRIRPSGPAAGARPRPKGVRPGTGRMYTFEWNTTKGTPAASAATMAPRANIVQATTSGCSSWIAAVVSAA